MDVIEIPEATFYRLPSHVQEMIRVYGGAIAQARNGLLWFRVDHCRAEEILAVIRNAGTTGSGSHP